MGTRTEGGEGVGREGREDGEEMYKRKSDVRTGLPVG